MGFRWREGMPVPVGVTAEQAKEAIDALGDAATAESLVEASRSSNHVLHGEFWREGNEVWAQRARLSHARQIIGGIVAEIEIGGKAFESREFEMVRGSYRSITVIAADKDMLGELIEDVAQQLGALQAKLLRINMLRKG